MFAPMGNAMYRFSCVSAALLLAIAAIEWSVEPRHRQGGMIILTGLAVAAVVVWLVGRACREAR
jgi:hypothetical protein